MITVVCGLNPAKVISGIDEPIVRATAPSEWAHYCTGAYRYSAQDGGPGLSIVAGSVVLTKHLWKARGGGRPFVTHPDH